VAQLEKSDVLKLLTTGVMELVVVRRSDEETLRSQVSSYFLCNSNSSR